MISAPLLLVVLAVLFLLFAVPAMTLLVAVWRRRHGDRPRETSQRRDS